jgi:hypothetical protein
MTVPEILKELEPYTGRFPMEAMRAAVDQREAITPELLEEVRQAYAAGLIDETVVDLPEIERDIAAPEPGRLGRRTLITDALGELEGWACFHREDSEPPEPLEVEPPAPPPPPPPPPPAEYAPPKPFVRGPKIGRNVPCPCGSGKKYKKCCGKGQSATSGSPKP